MGGRWPDDGRLRHGHRPAGTPCKRPDIQRVRHPLTPVARTWAWRVVEVAGGVCARGVAGARGGSRGTLPQTLPTPPTAPGCRGAVAPTALAQTAPECADRPGPSDCLVALEPSISLATAAVPWPSHCPVARQEKCKKKKPRKAFVDAEDFEKARAEWQQERKVVWGVAVVGLRGRRGFPEGGSASR